MIIRQMFLQIETNIFQVYYIVFTKELIISFPPTPRQKYVSWLERICIYHHF